MTSIFTLNEWPTSAIDLYEKYAEPLTAQLRQRFKSTDAHLVYDAVIGATLDVALKLDRLDAPDDLHCLLYVAALRKLLASRRSDESRRIRETTCGAAFVAERQEAAREQCEALAEAELLERVFKIVPENDEERTVLQHWGEDFREIACALEWKDLPEEEQSKRVKMIRDRLGKRLKRFIEDPAL